MNDPLGVNPSKGNQGTTRGKEKSFDLGGNRTHDLRIRSTVTLPTELRGRTEKVGDDLGGESRRRESKGTYSIVERALPFDHQLSCTIIDYHQLSFSLSLFKFFMIVNDSFSRLTTRMIVHDSFSVSCFDNH